MITKLLLISCVALGACSSGTPTETAQSPAISSPGAGRGEEVTIKTFIFRPNPLTVKAGTEVTWVNQDEILHTVTSGTRTQTDGTEEIRKDGTFDESLDGVGATFKFRFMEPGTYPYLCTIHPGMDAEVIVE